MVVVRDRLIRWGECYSDHAINLCNPAAAHEQQLLAPDESAICARLHAVKSRSPFPKPFEDWDLSIHGAGSVDRSTVHELMDYRYM